MHERFCFWSYGEWQEQLVHCGFHIHPLSRSYRNDWIVNHRFKGKATLYRQNGLVLEEMDYPVTHMLLIAEK
jgi:hypothetical protein